MARVIIAGEPGETYTNSTGKVAYQFLCDWSNTCGQCAQYDHQVGPTWPIPLHRGCKCKQIAIWPGDTSRPFADFRDKIASLPDDQKAKVVGVANLKLIESGTVEWDDVVTGQRVRDLREVVAAKQLSVDAMAKAGVGAATARQAFEAVHTPAHELAAKKRAELIQKILDKGTQKDALRTALAEKLAARVGIASGPSTPPPVPTKPTSPRPRTKPAVPLPVPVPLGARQRADYLLKAKVKPDVVAKAIESESPGSPILPGRPLVERLAAYKDGDRKVKAIQKIGKRLEAMEGKLAALEARKTKLMGSMSDDDWLDSNAEARPKRQAIFALEEEQGKILAERSEAQAKTLDEVLAIAQVDPARRAAVVASSIERLPESMRRRAGQVADQLARLVAGPDRTVGFSWDTFKEGESQRAFHYGDEQESLTGEKYRVSRVKVGNLTPRSVIAHEIAHAVEWSVPGVHRSAVEFRTYRLAGEAQTPLKQIAPDSGYDEWETGAKDDFGRYFSGTSAYYVGKEYRHENSEILSMGVQALFQDAPKFAKADPEYLKFVLGVLDGSLR